MFLACVRMSPHAQNATYTTFLGFCYTACVFLNSLLENCIGSASQPKTRCLQLVRRLAAAFLASLEMHPHVRTTYAMFLGLCCAACVLRARVFIETEHYFCREGFVRVRSTLSISMFMSSFVAARLP